MKPKNRTFLSFLGLVMVLGLLLFFKKTRTRETPNESGLRTESMPAEAGADQKPQPSLDPAEYQEVVAWDQTERDLDLKRLPLTIVNGEALLNFDIVTKGTCFPGDANAIEMDLKAVPTHKLLATLESLSSEGGPTLAWDVPTDFLSRGIASHQFKVPVTKEPAQYGFFVCTANPSDRSCRSKKVRDMNEVFTEHLRKDPSAGSELRALFFQYLILDLRGLATFSRPQRGDHSFEVLKVYAKKRNMKGDVAKELDKAKLNIHTLVSYPFAFEDGKFKVELPKYDAQECAKQKNGG